MRAVGVTEFGGPEALRVVDVPERHASTGEVRIRVHAATVNPTDTFIRNGARAELLAEHPPPYVPGMDVAGVLDEIGAGAQTDLRVGDHVMAIVVPRGSHGGYSESLVLPAESVVRVPAGVDDVAASTLPMNGLTARMALDMLALDAGQVLAVTGAAGALGGYAIQLAKADGLQVIADAAERDRELVRSLGADVVVDRGDDVAARIREVEPEGVHGVVDTALLNELVVPAVRDGGGVATVRGFDGEAERNVKYHPVFVREYFRENAKLDRLRQQVEDGAITLRVARTFEPEQAGEAHRTLEAGGTRGRLVIVF
ncbi:NADP-dependent oxidoreductase [Saccharopolyspora sp. K220]|uniref:NADP-dependent oxidoreductase n=1 Tax=Saccharopolyspora soli TaxID=2926618 RepID=UPI001F59578A|nr:NADP-dependent oxidoreductase [Saccharopolyspora soli]MCI2416009.1 NADP-dependent oxidoreductase [Saccharopolyspora soli]